MSYKTLIIFLAIIVPIIGLTSLLPSWFQLKSPDQSFSNVATDNNKTGKPKAEITQAFFNLGEMKLADVKQQDFTLKNIGEQPLKILDVTTNCGCTAGQIIYQGKTSEEYSMGWPGSNVAEINPGDTATVRLTYRPATMPVYGLVEREVYVTTNNPSRSKLIFGIKVIVK